MKATALEIVLVGLFSFLFTVAVIVAVSALSALILCWAWNMFMPAVFGLPGITFWQAFALTILLGSIRQVITIATKKKD